MTTSIRLISTYALLGLGISGLVGCYGGTVTAEDELEQTGDLQEQPAGEEQAPEADTPAVIVNEAPVINVLDVSCLEPEDADGMDEPALVINGKTVWAGAGFVPGTTQEVTYEERAFGEMVVVEIWEQDVWDDFTDPNDLLGRIEIPAGEMGSGPQIAEIKEKGGSYELLYQVERCQGCEPGEQPNL
jgi:hypothetical protein